MTIFYSQTTKGFYPENMRSDYDAAGSWPDDAVAVSGEEEARLRAEAAIPTEANLCIAYQAAAQEALRTSDITIMRCFESG